MSATLNISRSEALRGAPLNSWIALSGDETHVIAAGTSYEEVSQRLDEARIQDALILKTPESWLRLAI